MVVASTIDGRLLFLLLLLLLLLFVDCAVDIGWDGDDEKRGMRDDDDADDDMEWSAGRKRGGSSSRLLWWLLPDVIVKLKPKHVAGEVCAASIMVAVAMNNK